MLLKFLGKYRDVGLLVLRLGLGIMFMAHGLPKLAGRTYPLDHFGEKHEPLRYRHFPDVLGTDGCCQ